MKEFEVRTEAQITFDFVIKAKNQIDAGSQVEKLLPYIEFGKLENQPVSVRCGKGQLLRSLFIMENEIQDCNEL